MITLMCHHETIFSQFFEWIHHFHNYFDGYMVPYCILELDKQVVFKLHQSLQGKSD